MPFKKHIRPGKIEASPDGDALVVHFTSEITHLDEDGMPINVERMPDKREVPVGQAMRGLRAEDLPSLAQDIVEKCRYIPESKTSQVEKVLNKLYAQTSGAPFSKDFGAGATQSSTNRTSGTSGEDSVLEDLLPSASIHVLDEYVEELYEEEMDNKIRGALRLLRLCTEVRHLEQMAEHTTLLGVLSRELREHAKRSYELAVAITGVFLIFANFSCFHGALKRHQCGEVTMRILEYETKRRNVLKNDLAQTQEKMAAQTSQGGNERARLQHALGRCKTRLERQDHLLQICVLVLRALSEDTAQELKFVKQKLCQMLVPMLGRHEDLLLSTLSMLHKLSVFEQNKDMLLKVEVTQRLAELLGHPAPEVAFLAMRVCFNLSFDPKGRAALASQSNVVARLMAAVQNPSMRKVALKLLYHMTVDPAARSSLTSRHPTIASLAIHLVNRSSKEQDVEAVALLLNLAADEAAACLLLAEEAFVSVAWRGIKGKNQLMLKVLRHVASHRASRSILLDVMGGGPDGPGSSYAWLLELVHVAKSTATERHDVLVEALGTLAALDCTSPEVPWPELCEAGLLDLLSRLLMVGFSEDDVILEAVILLGVLALDPPTAALLASSKVIGLLPDVLAAKPKDGDLMVQLTFLLRCLLMNDETQKAVIQTDAPARVMELLRSPEPVVQDAAEELLDLIVAVETHGQQRKWTKHIQEYKFKVHNLEWLEAQETESVDALRPRRKEPSEKRSPSRDASKRSTMNASTSGASGWGESSDVEDRREGRREERRRKKRGKS
mmetsp:Transcript_7973/g.18484  ORF Transcript_7973/g.18484 Transcript_7973/m.18484 type:complete len:782 (-) Transcript_7973:162-2507(-)